MPARHGGVKMMVNATMTRLMVGDTDGMILLSSGVNINIQAAMRR
jgi:hypothetical protein